MGRQGTGITTYGNFIQTEAAINPGNSGGPAAMAGLRAGDVILGVDDREVGDANELMNTIAQVRPGTTVGLSLLRDGKNMTRRIRITDPNSGKGSISPNPLLKGS